MRTWAPGGGTAGMGGSTLCLIPTERGTCGAPGGAGQPFSWDHRHLQKDEVQESKHGRLPRGCLNFGTVLMTRSSSPASASSPAGPLGLESNRSARVAGTLARAEEKPHCLSRPRCLSGPPRRQRGPRAAHTPASGCGEGPRARPRTGAWLAWRHVPSEVLGRPRPSAGLCACTLALTPLP